MANYLDAPGYSLPGFEKEVPAPRRDGAEIHQSAFNELFHVWRLSEQDKTPPGALANDAAPMTPPQ